MAARDVQILRVYDDDGTISGYRVLVDRLWPRGVAKSRLRLDEWAKDLAPTTDLRTWYGHDPDKYLEFARRYRAELRTRPAAEALARLRSSVRRRILLLTATKDVSHSAARVLQQQLLSQARGR